MEYFKPKTLSEACILLAKWGSKAKIVAGGTNVVPDLRAKAIKTGALIDLSRLKNLSYIKEEKKRIRIGGLTLISEMAASPVLQKYAAILSEAARQLGNPLVRNRATLAGNLADASPAADTAVPLLALDAVVVTSRNKEGRREIPIDRFFLGPNRTVLKKEEILCEVIFPKPEKEARMLYFKLGLRNAMAISVVSIAVLMEVERGICRKARVALGAVAPRPLRASDVEEILTNQKITEELIEACCEKIKKEINPISDIRASADYRRSVAQVLLKRLIKEIVSNSRDAEPSSA